MSLAVRHVATWKKALAASEDRRARAAKLAQDRALAGAVPRMARRVSAAFLALSRSSVHGPAIKQITYPLTYDEPSWDAFSRTMRQILIEEYLNLGELAFGALEGQLGISLVFDLNERIIRDADIANRVTGILGDSKDAIRSTIRQGIDDGVHPSVIAKRMRDQMEQWAGLEDLSRSRAYTIARTETANAYNLGAIEGYRQTGIISKLRVLDGATCGWNGHNDPDTAQGKIVTLDQASRQPISHPNCVRAFAPIAAGLEQPTSRDEEEQRLLSLLPNADPAQVARYRMLEGFTSENLQDITTGLEQLKSAGANLDLVQYVRSGGLFGGSVTIPSGTLEGAFQILLEPSRITREYLASLTTHVTEGTAAGVVRHEFGHIAHKTLSKTAAKEFRALWSANKNVFVSGRAADNIDEWAGEVFAKITAPGYRRGDLPFDDALWRILRSGPAVN